MRSNLETLSIRVLEIKLAKAAAGSREERAIREELRRREIEYSRDDATGLLPFEGTESQAGGSRYNQETESQAGESQAGGLRYNK